MYYSAHSQSICQQLTSSMSLFRCVSVALTPVMVLLGEITGAGLRVNNSTPCALIQRNWITCETDLNSKVIKKAKKIPKSLKSKRSNTNSNRTVCFNGQWLLLALKRVSNNIQLQQITYGPFLLLLLIVAFCKGFFCYFIKYIIRAYNLITTYILLYKHTHCDSCRIICIYMYIIYLLFLYLYNYISSLFLPYRVLELITEIIIPYF